MKLERLSAILLIAAFLAIMLSTVVNAPGLYQTQNIEERLQIIENYRSRWLVDRALNFLFALLTIVGFFQLTSVLRPKVGTWIPTLGAVAITAGIISALYFVYLQTMDPRGGYSGAYPVPENLAYWLLLAGTCLFGLAFLRADLPAWLGYVTAGLSLAYGVLYFFTGFGAVTPFLVGFLEVLIGIVMLRR